MKLSKIAKIAKEYDHVHLIGHVHPDGDCLGATLAMCMLLERLDVKATVLLEESPLGYEYLPMATYISHDIPEECELLITLDSSDIERLGKFGSLIEGAKRIINIDHHFSNTLFGDDNIVDAKASSTCELLYQLIDDKSILDRSIAEALYTGIIYDTGCFKHSNTTDLTHTTAGALIQYGFDFTWIINHMFFEKPFKTYKAQGLAYARLMVLEEGKVAISYLNLEDFQKLELVKAHTESIVQYMNEIAGVEVALFFYEIEEGLYKVSLRSKGQVDVCLVASKFGGGGHIKASGASLSGSIDEVIEAVMDEVLIQLEGEA